MRIHLALLVAALASTACGTPNDKPVRAAPTPSTWQPTFWDQTLSAAKQAHERGDKLAAENLCAQAIRYVEGQTVREMYEYSTFLDGQQPGSGQTMRAKADRLEQAKAEQARATEAGSTYLGFAPWTELGAYVDALKKAHRETEASAIARLGAAYQYSQEAYLRRSQLMRAGKDPRGEC